MPFSIPSAGHRTLPAGLKSAFTYERHSTEALTAYHCWALFRIPGKTWVSVDCSEADRLPERRMYFFGSHTPNRVALSTGRDIILEPPGRSLRLSAVGIQSFPMELRALFR